MAKVLFLILSLIYFNADMLLAQDDGIIQDIRTKCNIIDGVKTYKKVQIDVMDKSTEGGIVIGYFDSSELKKIVGKFYGEIGQVIEEYYLWQGSLVFVLSETSKYKYPISYNHKPIGEIDKTEKERYYFKDNRMIGWVKPNGKVVAKDNSGYYQQEKVLIEEAKELINRIRKEH